MKNKYYRINKILNNNAIEILENGTEIIIIGNGVGFNHKVNDYITMKENYKLYTLQNNLLKIQFKALLNEIPFKCIELTQEIIDMAKTDLNRNFNQGLLVSLSDHINFVSKNYLKGYGSYSLVSEEIKRFYHEEYEVGLKALDLINRYYQINLNKKEASAIAFHLINAEFNNNVSKTTSILKSIDDILNIIEANLGLELQEDSLYYSRLVIHLKFFMQRVIKGESDDENFEKLIISAKSDINKKIGITLDSIERYLNEEFDYVLSEAGTILFISTYFKNNIEENNMDYKEIADQIIIAIGGQDNVKYVTHCVTRLRFVLKNKNLVNQDKINEIDGVLGSTFGAGQFQIIMGKNLSATFTQVVKNYNFEVAEIIDEILDEDIKEKDDSPIWKEE